MPESPSSFDIDLSATPVPLRPGEEGSQALLNMEHQRRQSGAVEQLRAQLRAQLDLLDGKNPARGGSESRRNRVIYEKQSELKGLTRWTGYGWEGPCAPATVINFNPIELRLFGELARWTIPAAGVGKGEFIDTGRKVKISWNGRSFAASYMTLSDPHIWSVIMGAHDGVVGIETSMEARYIPPIGLAHQFYDHYVVGAADAQGMGGVLIFQGDIHTLDAKRMKTTEGKILVPQARQGDEGRVTYTVVEESFEQCLQDCLTRQRNYANGVIAEGHSYATSSSDMIKNQLSRSHHILWHNWAIDRGYKREPESWASERLDDSPNVEAVHCPACHQRQTSTAQYFCSNCNAPFDACKAFLAGKPVSADWLGSYSVDSPEFTQILAEAKRRKANIAMLELPDDEPKKGKAK